MNLFYSIDIIRNNDNLLLNLKNDIVFKNCFLYEDCKYYLVKLLNLIFNLECEDIIIKNNELKSDNLKDKSSFTDLICSKGNIDYIIEMNNFRSNMILEKNMGYLFRQHIRKVSKKNKYGKDKYTYLINIDNFDAINKDELIYESLLNFPKYNLTLYNNIKVLHINLAYLKKKLYNVSRYEELTFLEKYLLIFIIQEKDKLRKIINCKEIEGVIKTMDRIKMENDYIATYDREEFEKMLKEEYEDDIKQLRFDKEKFANDKEKFANDKEKFANDKEKFANDKEKFANDKELFNNEKKNIIREFKKMGLSFNKISKITNIPVEQIKILL